MIMNRTMFFAAVAGCVALGACAGNRSQSTQAQATPSAGGAFTNELSRQYYGFAEQQRLQAWDYSSYSYFDRKGDRAARGEAIAPETPGQGWTPRDRNVGRDLTAG